MQGFIPAPYFALYASTKHAVEGYSESLDHEQRPFGIRVVLVEPPPIPRRHSRIISPGRISCLINDSARAGMNAVVRKAMEKGDAPEVVAKTVLAAATDPAPKRRYAAGRWRARLVSCAVSSPHPHSTRVCESSSGCRSDVDINDILFRLNRQEL